MYDVYFNELNFEWTKRNKPLQVHVAVALGGRRKSFVISYRV